MGLNPKQQRFVEEYCKDMNATQAAIRAGYSPRTARAQGHALLTKPDTKEAVAALREKQSRKSEVDRQWIIEKLKQIAEEDDLHGSVKVQAIDKLAKVVGAYERDNDQRTRISVEVRKRIIDKDQADG